MPKLIASLFIICLGMRTRFLFAIKKFTSDSFYPREKANTHPRTRWLFFFKTIVFQWNLTIKKRVFLENGCDARYIQKFLRHNNLNTSQIYIKVRASNLKEVYQKFHPYFEMIVSFLYKLLDCNINIDIPYKI